MVETGWCRLIPSLLHLPDHDSREKVMVAMETVLPACQADFQEAVPALRSLQEDYQQLMAEEGEEEEDGYFQGLLAMAQRLSSRLTTKDEL
nr:hypothetical protein BaRGS_018417 [Batillaria attramentaria]